MTQRSVYTDPTRRHCDRPRSYLLGESSKFPKSCSLENLNLKIAVCLQNIKNQIPLEIKALRVLMETMSCDFSSCRLSRVHFCR